MRPRGTLTVLFTDLVDSSRLHRELGDDRAQRRNRAHFRLLRKTVTAHRGQEVKSIGDGLMVVFDSAVDALSCATAMQRAVQRDNAARGTSAALEVRVGLHAGEPVREEDDFFGSAVLVARRVCDAAGGGQIVASGLVRELVGSRGGFAFRALGPHDLKGLTEPVPLFELLWQREAEAVAEAPAPSAEAARPPLPATLARRERKTFVGRQGELAQLRAAWERAVAGERRLVFVAGDAGIGKTSLAAEFALAAYGEGATVLYGRCDEEALVPYQPIVHALRETMLAQPATALSEARWVEDELARLVPEVADRLPQRRQAGRGLGEQLPGDAEGERYRLFEAIGVALSGIARRAPLLLVLDDLHWADKPTLTLLRHVARSPSDAPLLILGTYREAELMRTHPLADTLANIRRDRLFERISLKGLSEADARALVARQVGEVSDAVARAIYAQTEGNPFFIEEVLNHLAETAGGRADWATDPAAIDRLGIPEGIREVIGRRLSNLSSECNRVLSIASVVGPEFELPLLERVAEIDDAALLDVMDEAMTAHVVSETAGDVDLYSFSHALVRRTLHDELTTSRRVRLHRRVAEALEQLHTPDLHLGELAYHFLQAGVSDKAIEYSRRAGERATQLLAYEEAADHYERALQALELHDAPDDACRCRLLLDLGEAQLKAGATATSKETFRQAAEVARSLGDADALARAALGLAGPWVGAGFAGETIAPLLEEAIAAQGDGDLGMRARLLARLAVELYYTSGLEHRADLSRQAVEAARASGDPATLAYALNARYYTIWAPGSVEERLAIASEMLDLAEQAEDRDLALQARHFRTLGFLERGDLPALDQEIETYGRLAQESRQPIHLYRHAARLAMRALLDGRFDDAERHAQEARSIGERAQDPNAQQEFAVQMMMLRREQGRLQELEGIVEALTERYMAIPAWRFARALIHAELGREPQVRSELDALAGERFADVPQDANWFASMAILSIVCAFLNDAERGGWLYEALRPFAAENVIIGAGGAFLGSVSHCLGLLATVLGRHDDAASHFDDALAVHERLGARPWTAHTQLAYARLLHARAAPGDRDRAREAAAAALATAKELGMKSLIEPLEKERSR